MNRAFLEIERKFLVAEPPPLEGLKAEAVLQGYLTQPGDSAQIRVRRKGEAYFLTVKGEGILSRMEREISIDAEQFEALWPVTEGRRLEKTRYVGTLEAGVIFELDVFSGALAPLVLVETEFETIAEAEAFSPPPWFGAEVTADPRFRNAALALYGAPEL